MTVLHTVDYINPLLKRWQNDRTQMQKDNGRVL